MSLAIEELHKDFNAWFAYFESIEEPRIKALALIDRLDFQIFDLSRNPPTEEASVEIEKCQRLRDEVQSALRAEDNTNSVKAERLAFLRSRRRIYIAEGDGHMKVGISANVIRRQRELSKLSPGVQMSVVWPGNYSDEKAVHACLSEFKICGEWFETSTESIAALIGFINQNNINPTVRPS